MTFVLSNQRYRSLTTEQLGAAGGQATRDEGKTFQTLGAVLAGGAIGSFVLFGALYARGGGDEPAVTRVWLTPTGVALTGTWN